MKIFKSLDMKGSSILNSPSVIWKFTRQQYELVKDSVPDGSTVAITDEVAIFEKADGALKPYTSSKASNLEQATIDDVVANTEYFVDGIVADINGNMIIQLYKQDVGEETTVNVGDFTNLANFYRDEYLTLSSNKVAVVKDFSPTTSLSSSIYSSAYLDKSAFKDITIKVEVV